MTTKASSFRVAALPANNSLTLGVLAGFGVVVSAHHHHLWEAGLCAGC